MRMVDPDTTVHLVEVRPIGDSPPYLILAHGGERDACELKKFLRDQVMIMHEPGIYEVTGKVTVDGLHGTHWQRADVPDIAALARQNFTVTSVPFTFPIPLDKRRRLQSAAAEQGLTPNDWVTQAIDEKLTKGLGE